MNMFQNSSFYKFFPVPARRLPALRRALQKGGTGRVKGLLILAEEGINGSFCARPSDAEDYKRLIEYLFQNPPGGFFYKDSFCSEWSFRRLFVKVKREIVTMERPFSFSSAPSAKEAAKAGAGSGPPAEAEEKPPRPVACKTSPAPHLSPEEWEKRLKNGGAQILDVRNDYETETGKFKGAVSMNIQRFKTFPDKLKEGLSKGFEGDARLNPKKETLIYCTGGVRCEKAALAMKDLGFQKVFQLQGGILNYLKNRPKTRRSLFERECFVFDHRAAVDENLKPYDQYRLCPHCGQPGREKIACSHCGGAAQVCRRCLDKASCGKTCSKNCAYHFRKGHRFKQRARAQPLKNLSGASRS